jgi:magnesium transporter
MLERLQNRLGRCVRPHQSGLRELGQTVWVSSPFHQDCRHQHQRPKVEEFPGYYFIVLYEAVLNEAGRLQLGELGIFLGQNYLVTVHSQPIRAIETAERLSVAR